MRWTLARRPAARALAVLALVLVLGPARLAAQDARLRCDPDLHDPNPTCGPGRTCELLSGDCGLFGFLCHDGWLWRLPRIDLGQCRGCRDAVGGCNLEPCNSDADCIAEVEGCRGGACRKAPGRCLSNDDCASPERCLDRRCTTPQPAPGGGGSTGLGPTCTSTADCPAGTVCKAPLGRCVVACEPSSTAPNKGCPPGTLCVTTGSLAGTCAAF
jgi:hypothetical protein